MQMSATECTDLGPRAGIGPPELYGLDDKVTAHFGQNCLLARRLVERGVRFVQVYSGGNEGPKAWDAHDDLKKNHDLHCAETDRPDRRAARRSASRAACSTRRSSSGAASSAARPSPENGKGRDHHPEGLHDVDGRRRHQRRHDPRRDRRVRLRRHRGQGLRARPARHDACTCSASITRS